MQLRGWRVLVWVAVYAIALHTIFWSGTPLRLASVDPFSIICHSQGAPPAEQTPASPAPSHACDHCNLCSAMAPPSPEPAAAIAHLAPMRLIAILRPQSSARVFSLAAILKLARGPPVVV